MNNSNSSEDVLKDITSAEYKYGFTTDIETEVIPTGLNEDVVRLISSKKGEPDWMLQFRLDAYRWWKEQPRPKWGHVKVEEVDYDKISFYAAPKKKTENKEVDPEILKTFDKLGIPLHEREMLLNGDPLRPSDTSPLMGRNGLKEEGDQGLPIKGEVAHSAGEGLMAVDAIVDSESQKTTYRDKLAELGIIFCSFGEAVREYPDLVRKYLGKVVPTRDNYYSALNSAVFSDGSFVYIPKGVRCPMELASYFRINSSGTGQFERTLIIADEEAYVSYLEGCTAPMRDENQLHAAVVEIYVHDRAEVKYSTVQNWYPGDKNGKGGVYNLVTKRALCAGDFSKISWTQVETGSAITWKYPSCVLKGDNSSGEFYSVAVTNNYQEADTGTKMIHIGKNSHSRIISKGISAGHSQNSYRGLVKVMPGADGVRNFTQCDSLLLSDCCGAHTFPIMDVQNPTAIVEHEATTSKINEEQLFYCQQRGIKEEDAVGLIVGGYAKEVVSKLPMEFAVEAQKLLSLSIENSVG